MCNKKLNIQRHFLRNGEIFLEVTRTLMDDMWTGNINS